MYPILFFFLRLLSYVPFGLLYIISDVLFYPLYYVVRYRRKIVRKNLTETFPQKDLAEIKRIEKRFYHFFVDMVFESLKLCSISPEEMVRRARFTNPELIRSMLDDGTSVSVYIGHYCNWEWITTTGIWLGDKATVVQIYHKLSNKLMDKFVMQLRERFGNKCVEMHDTARYIASASKDGTPRVIGFLADQSPRKKDAKYYIDFLNHKVPVLTGTEKLIKHFGHKVLFVRVKRVKRGYYEYEFVPMTDSPSSLPDRPSSMTDSPSSLPDFALTDRYFQLLEQEIMAQPEFFLWSHKRFRLAKY